VTILVTGGNGQLATALEAAKGARKLVRVGRPELDFDDPETIGAAFRRVAPDLVVNAAAWTAVDAAESNAEAAERANVAGPGLLATLAGAAGVPIIHVSTDYVFDGTKGAPYTEDDPTSPTGVYGETKLAGERAVQAANPRAIILRTSWVYAPYGRNFIRTMLGAARKTRTLRVVADQRGCPTSAEDLAAAILAITDRLAGGWRDEYAGVFHAAGTGETTWHGLATAAFEAAARHGMAMPEITPIATEDWPTPARRPADSRLDCGKLERVYGVRLPEWRGSVARTVDAIMQAEAASA
jgi:dTDP-4-dehydrorhamnose reductase